MNDKNNVENNDNIMNDKHNNTNDTYIKEKVNK